MRSKSRARVALACRAVSPFEALKALTRAELKFRAEVDLDFGAVEACQVSTTELR